MEHYYGNKYECKKVFLDYFREIGVIAPACRKAGISRGTFYRWVDQDEAFASMITEAMESAYEKNKVQLDRVPLHKRSSFLSMVSV